MAADMEAYHDHLDFRRVDDFDDEAFAYVMPKVKGINMLDLNETYIGNKSIALLCQLEYVKELRIKGCDAVDNDAIPFIRQINELEYLHAKDTGITIDGLLKLGPSDTFKEILFSHEGAEDISAKMAALIRLMPNCRFVINGKPY